MKTRIIVDSTADLPAEVKARMRVVPLTVHFGAETYIDGVTIDHQAFYEKLIETDVIPTTSQASPHDFEQVYRQVREAGETAVVVTVTGKLSGTYQSAVIAAEEYPEICVVDSTTVAIGAGILAEYGLQLADQGMDAPSIAEALTAVRDKIQVIALIDTLEYLKKVADFPMPPPLPVLCCPSSRCFASGMVKSSYWTRPAVPSRATTCWSRKLKRPAASGLICP